MLKRFRKSVVVFCICLCLPLSFVGCKKKTTDSDSKQEETDQARYEKLVALYNDDSSVEKEGYEIVVGTDGSVAIVSVLDKEVIKLDIPEKIDGKTVKMIYPYALSNLYQVTEITIPDSVVALGTGAFAEDYFLEKITIGSGLEFIGRVLFTHCGQLVNINVSADNKNLMFDGKGLLTKDGKSLIYVCDVMDTTYYAVPNGVEDILDDAFVGLTSIKKISLPDSVKAIADGAFYGCESIEEIIVSEGNKYFSYENGALYDYDMTVLYTYLYSNPAKTYKIPDSVNIISTMALSGNPKVEKVYLGKNVQILGDFAFAGCYMLSEVSGTEQVVYIGNGAFYDCSGLCNIEMSEVLHYIGERAFYNTFKLDTVTIPSSVTEISAHAFEKSGILYLNLPETLKKIDEYAFADCAFLNTFMVPESLEYIGDNAFQGCLYVENFTLGSKLSYIGNDVFLDGHPSLFLYVFEKNTYAKQFAEENGYDFYEYR